MGVEESSGSVVLDVEVGVSMEASTPEGELSFSFTYSVRPSNVPRLELSN